MADCRSGRINCIVVKDHSRFGRNAARMTIILEDDLDGIRYISNLDHFDSLYDDYDCMFQIKTTFNQMYAEDISRKIHSSVDSRQKQGQFIGSFCAYGYVKSRADRHRLEIDEEVKPVVEMIFDLRLQGMNTQAIARHLNSLQIPPPSVYKQMKGLNYVNPFSRQFETTRLWTFSTIYRILTNETYCGNLVQGRKRQKMRKKPKAKPKSQWVVAKNSVPPIISQETFCEVQRLMKEAGHIKALDGGNVRTFAGFIKCGQCGHAFVKAQKKETLYYVCRTRKAQGKQYCSNVSIREDILEQIILEDLNSILREITDLTPFLESRTADPEKESLKQRLERLRAEADKTALHRRNAYVDYQDELITRTDYLCIKEDLDQKEQQLNKQIEQLADTLESWEKQKEPNLFISGLVETKHIDKLDRAVLQEMVEAVYIYEDNRIKIIYKFNDPFD